MLLETDLRALVKKVWGRGVGLVWQEPGRGGTVGAADVQIAVPRIGWLPVELKVWEATARGGSGGLKAVVRPAQRRYHLQSGVQGARTAFLIAVKTELNSRIWTFPGSYCPVVDAAVSTAFMTDVGWEAEPAPVLKDRLLQIYRSSAFWAGKAQ